MSTVTLFGAGNPGTTPTNVDALSINLATAFQITPGTTGWTVTGLRFWLDAASNAPLTGYQGMLASGSNLVTTLGTLTFGTAVKGGWNTASLATPVALVPGTVYWASIFYPGGCYPASSHEFNGAVTSVDNPALFAPASSAVTPGNGAYKYATFANDWSGGPGSFNNTFYGPDVVIDDGVVLNPGVNPLIAGSIAPRAFAGSITPRSFAGTIGPRAWNGSIQ